jgi:hypothetical protein
MRRRPMKQPLWGMRCSQRGRMTKRLKVEVNMGRVARPWQRGARSWRSRSSSPWSRAGAGPGICRQPGHPTRSIFSFLTGTRAKHEASFILYILTEASLSDPPSLIDVIRHPMTWRRRHLAGRPYVGGRPRARGGSCGATPARTAPASPPMARRVGPGSY